MAVLDLGARVDWHGSSTELREVRGDFVQPGLESPGSGLEWLGLDVRTCADTQSVDAGWYRFAAFGTEGERFPGAMLDTAWSGAYPTGSIPPGMCATGWVLVAVVAGTEVATVRYEDPDGVPIAEWHLPGGQR